MSDVLLATVVVVAAVAAVVALGVLTGVGARRRGCGWAVTVASGAFFPLTWIVWYRHDYPQTPARRASW